MKRTRKRRIDPLKFICWIIVPSGLLLLFLLDMFELYTFTAARLLALGGCLMVILLPLCSEITIKDISIKRDKNKAEKKTGGIKDARYTTNIH